MSRRQSRGRTGCTRCKRCTRCTGCSSRQAGRRARRASRDAAPCALADGSLPSRARALPRRTRPALARSFQQWAFGEGGLREIWANLPAQGQCLFPLLRSTSDLLMMPKDLLLEEGIRADMCASVSAGGARRVRSLRCVLCLGGPLVCGAHGARPAGARCAARRLTCAHPVTGTRPAVAAGHAGVHAGALPGGRLQQGGHPSRWGAREGGTRCAGVGAWLCSQRGLHAMHPHAHPPRVSDQGSSTHTSGAAHTNSALHARTRRRAVCAALRVRRVWAGRRQPRARPGGGGRVHLLQPHGRHGHGARAWRVRARACACCRCDAHADTDGIIAGVGGRVLGGLAHALRGRSAWHARHPHIP